MVTDEVNGSRCSAAGFNTSSPFPVLGRLVGLLSSSCCVTGDAGREGEGWGAAARRCDALTKPLLCYQLLLLLVLSTISDGPSLSPGRNPPEPGALLFNTRSPEEQRFECHVHAVMSGEKIKI